MHSDSCFKHHERKRQLHRLRSSPFAGVERLTGGIYDAGGDPSVAFDSQGHVYYGGLGFDRTAPPNTVAVNKGTFDNSGHLSWSAPTFINATTAPSTLNDKPWVAVDSHASSPFS